MKPRGTARRDRLVRELIASGIKHPRVLDAMRGVARDRFVEEALDGAAYRGAALPIGASQTISQPWIVARMCELLEPDGRGRVLEVGTGSGYHAAVLAGLFELVFSVERIAALSEHARRTVRELGLENVHFKIFDGTYGWSEFAPYRAIVVTAVGPEIPGPLIEQLEDGGRLVMPLATAPDAEQVLTRVVRRGDELTREQHDPCRFVPLVGRFGWPE